jgi:hypothetical protein
MLSLLISWPVFLTGLERQPPSTRKHWLRHWAFSDDGALLIRQCAEGSHQSPTDHNQWLGELFYAAKRKWPEVFR